MHPELVKLLDLQAKDLILLDVNHRLDAVLAEVETLDRGVQQGEESLARARRAVQDAEKRRDELEAKIESYRKLQERRRQKLEYARGAKEAATFMAEIDLTRSVLAKEESEWMKVAESVTVLEAAVQATERQLEELRVAQAPMRAALDQRRGLLEAERQEAVLIRERAATEVDKTLRARYDRLRNSRSPNVVVALNGTACGSCFTTVPLNRRSQIRSGTLIDWCEGCGVILYAAEEVG